MIEFMYKRIEKSSRSKVEFGNGKHRYEHWYVECISLLCRSFGRSLCGFLSCRFALLD